MPDEEWPAFNGLMVDDVGRLRLGSIGYLDTQQNWKLLHPDPEEYFRNRVSYVWAPAALMLESSDGILWFGKYLDTGGQGEGTAWYDPETNEGCLFTNIPATVIEDENRQLWLVADGGLYRYSLNP